MYSCSLLRGDYWGDLAGETFLARRGQIPMGVGWGGEGRVLEQHVRKEAKMLLTDMAVCNQMEKTPRDERETPWDKLSLTYPPVQRACIIITMIQDGPTKLTQL